MDAKKLIGKTFAYKGIGNMVYIGGRASVGTQRGTIRRR